ncbi:Aminoacyl-tRNA synthetase, class I, conserved site-containing protein [Cynara cardunculus var. scolymus]|uniref:glutamine--tRNA ligase n=1 Tax=Cynara cardunculus var. scolymus TaxID=59895 RepID=A0A103Y4V8_CYNCS|nr:Aminoacyl-tRNA synthetase, class I, conserved site-containing protein [Cynara cardunculus var. scolymus]
MVEALDLFLKIGLDKRTAENTIANNKVTSNLVAVINEESAEVSRLDGLSVALFFVHSYEIDHLAAVTDGCERSTGNLLYTVATKFPANALVHRPKLLEYIVSSKIKAPAQVEAAFAFLTVTGSEDLDISKFEEACGVGVEVSVEDMERTVNEIFEERKSAILEQRYRTNVGDIFAQVRKKQPWADPKIVKQLIDSKLYALLGEKTAADNEKPVKKKKEKPVKVEDKSTTEEAPQSIPSEEELNPYLIFPAPEENYKVHTEVFFSDRPVLRACNSKAILEKHLKITGGKVLTRFPPEPNGYLHIGHAKAMFVDFGLAKERGGGCYLRYDDTNPEAEKKEYIDHIEEIVGWMGWKPFKITYTSDYFQELHDLAVELIRRGHAYVDHQTPDEIKEYREKKMNSPWRDRPISESLKLFDDMKRGMIEEGKATLRMKQDMQSDNFNISLHTHMLETSGVSIQVMIMHIALSILLKISHIRYVFCTMPLLLLPYLLCTLEFETRRASYYWLLDALSLYQPYVWEYSRLNITNTVMSKRKLNRLVTENYVDGWDDPRLMTLSGLRRRGVTSTAINTFVPFSSVVYIEQSDFRIKDSKDYYGLAPGKTVLLRYAFPIKCTEVVLSEDKKTVVEGVLHWVAEPSPGIDPLKVEVRLFEKLFLSENPGELDNWLDDLNPESKVVMTCAYAVPTLRDAAVDDKFQFERLGYFVADKDSTPEKLIFNRTVTLRDSYGKAWK